MTDLMTNTRKRLRSKSSELPYNPQTKHFISQQIMEKHDKNEIRRIHGKQKTAHAQCIIIG